MLFVSGDCGVIQTKHPAKVPLVEIRVAMHSDAEQVQEMAYSAMRAFGLAPDPEGIYVELGRFGEKLNGLLIQLVACVGDRIAGCISLSRKDPSTGKLSGFYVDPCFRGRGIGEKLIERTVSYAQTISLAGIYLETWDKMEAAVHLYIKLGWKRIDDPPAESGAQRAYYLELTADNKPLKNDAEKRAF